MKRRGCIVIALLAMSLPATAQVVRDGSLGMGTITDGMDSDGMFANYVITQEHGELSGSDNLFHSFSDFSLEMGEIASFTLTTDYAGDPIANIIAGVSGGASTIDGMIRTTSDLEGASLFLLNPSGIFFSDGAQLDVKGSFHASTADTLKFSDGADFDVLDTSPGRILSSANPFAFGFTRPDVNRLQVNQSNLSVLPGYTLSLIGGDEAGDPLAGTFILASGSSQVISAPGATVQIAAARPGVDIPVVLTDLVMDSLDPDDLGTVLVQNASVNVNSPDTATRAGSIVIRAGRFQMSGGAVLDTVNRSQDDALGAIDIAATREIVIESASQIKTTLPSPDVGAAGDIYLRAGQSVSVTGDSILQSLTNGDGQAGAIRIDADSIVIEDARILSRVFFSSGLPGAIDLDARSIELYGGARVVSETWGPGAGGDVGVRAQNLTISNTADHPSGAFIATNTTSTAEDAGNGGNLTVEVETLELLDGGQLFANTAGAGDAGELTVDASSLVHLSGVFRVSDDAVAPSGISSSALTTATGAGGRVVITSPVVEVHNGAQIVSDTIGAGPAGSVEIFASDRVTIEGGENGPSIVSAGSLAQAGSPMQLGSAGTIQIATDRFELVDGGQVTVSNSGTGDAGNINIRARTVAISGASDPAGENESAIFSQSLTDGVVDGGDGGDIAITAYESVSIFDGGRISTDTDGPGQGGSIDIVAAESVKLESGASISARASGLGDSAGDAGEIDIVSGGTFEVYDSTVTTEAANSSGGNIEIAANDLIYLESSLIETEVLAGNPDEAAGDVTAASEVVSLNHSHIIANAAGEDVDAGNISITVDQFVLSGDSFLQASAELGIDGTIDVSSPDTDLTGTLATLPESFLDASAMLARDCAARTARAGSFAVRTQGEIPPPPDAALGLDGFGVGITPNDGMEGCPLVEGPS